MSRTAYLATYPGAANRFNGGQSHWGIFLPNENDNDLGTMTHVTGTPFTGFGLEFKRNYDVVKTNRYTRLFPIADVDVEHLEAAAPSSSPERKEFTIDITPRNALEREAKKIDPPGPSREPLNPAVGKRCQAWVRDYVVRLVQRGIFPGNASSVLDEAKSALGEEWF